jgi:protein-S-isoprenylcysteine O-methyltransferase Ste14
MSERNRSAVQRWRVPLGFLAVAIFLVLAHPTWRLIAFGAPLTLMGLGVRAWASGHLRKNSTLATAGPYAFTRNPLYFGSLIMLMGVLISGGNVWLAMALLALFLLVYYRVMKNESLYMQELFLGDYERWASEVPLFVPRLVPLRGVSAEAYDIRLYLQHREYRALIGTATLYAALGLKLLLQDLR